VPRCTNARKHRSLPTLARSPRQGFRAMPSFQLSPSPSPPSLSLFLSSAFLLPTWPQFNEDQLFLWRYVKPPHGRSFPQVYFRCNGERAERSQQQDFVDPRTGTRVVEVELNVTRNEVEEYFGRERFKCECVAWSGPGQIRGQPATVEVACK